MKKYLIEILEYFKYKLENDKCTDEEMRQAFKMLREGTVCETTIKDIADYYGQSESNVRNIVSRNAVPKKRVLIYDFSRIVRLIPKRWQSKRKVNNNKV